MWRVLLSWLWRQLGLGGSHTSIRRVGEELKINSAAHTMIYTCALPLYAAPDQLPNWAFRDVTYRVGCRRPDLHLAVLFLRDDV